MPKPVYLNLQSNINQEVAIKLVTTVQAKLRDGMTDLHLLIASAGGFVDPGMAICNFLRGIPVPVSTYNYGNVDSVAGVIYCAGSRRVATPHCKFLVHSITWTFNQPTVATEHQLREYLRRAPMRTFRRADVEALRGRTARTEPLDLNAGTSVGPPPPTRPRSSTPSR